MRAVNVARSPVIVRPDVACFRPTQVLQRLAESRNARLCLRIALGKAHQHADPPHPVGLLRARREWPSQRRAAERYQQLPPSDGDCHAPLPREVRRGNDTTPRACSLHVRRAGCWLLPPQSPALTALLPPPALRERRHRGLARRLVAVRRPAVLVLAKGERPQPRRALRCRVHLHDRPTTAPSASTSKSSSVHSPDGREAEALEEQRGNVSLRW